MRQIILSFADASILNTLLLDHDFMSSIHYLNPRRTNNPLDVVLTDPVNANYIDTEVVVLTIFARGLKRCCFPNTTYDILFLNPAADEIKGGLHLNNVRVVTSTAVEF